jgi:glycosyltransferase involved in cell wall biosynthesis
MAIRILHVLTTDGRRGAETSALMVRDELRTRGHIADAVALVAAADGAHLDIPVLGSKRLGLPTLRALRRAARGSDLVIAHGSSTLPACSIALAASGIPFVYVNIGDLEYWAGSGVKKLRTRALLRRPRAVAARSERSAQTLRTTFGVAADRVVVVPNGRPAQRYPRTDEAGRASARARWGIATDAPVVAWVGALSSEKRPDLAVRAVAAVPETLLLIAGDGPLRGEVERLAAELTPGRSSRPTSASSVTSLTISEPEYWSNRATHSRLLRPFPRCTRHGVRWALQHMHDAPSIFPPKRSATDGSACCGALSEINTGTDCVKRGQLKN